MTEILGVTERQLDSWHRRAFVSSHSEESDQFYSFAEVVCLKSANLLTAKGVPDRLVRRLLDRLRVRLVELDDHLTHRSVSIFEDRVIFTSKNHFIDSRAGHALVRFDLDEMMDRMAAASSSAGRSKTAEEWCEEGLAEMSRSGGEDAALACFSEVLRSSPGRADVYINIGKIHYRQGRFLDAERALRLAIAREPYDPEAHLTLGRTLEKELCLDRAIACYEKALEIDPTLVQAHYEIGKACAKAGLRDRAVRHWNHFLTLDPDSPVSVAVRSQLHQLYEAESTVEV